MAQFRHNQSGRKDGEKLKDEGSSTKDEQTGDQKEVENMRFKTTQTEVQQL
jgi:hypothetical protein